MADVGSGLLTSSEGLDAAVPVAGTGLLDEPVAAGPLKRGFGAGVAAVKGNLYGAGALVAHGAAQLGVPGAAGVEKSALEASAAAGEEAAKDTQTLEQVNWKSPASIFGHFSFLLGNAVPSLALMAAGGVAGRGLAKLGARGVGEQAVKDLILKTGTLAGAVAPDVALEAGGIYPDALKTGVENPAARAALGGAAAASIDFLPLLAAEKYLKAAGKGGVGALIKGALKGAPVGGALEGTQEALQSVIERASAGQPTTGPEAMSDYLNSFAGGAVPGLIGGGILGAHRATAPKEGTNQPNVGTPVDINAPEPTGPLPTVTGPDLGAVETLPAVEGVNAPIETAPPLSTGVETPTAPVDQYNRIEAPVSLDADMAKHEQLTQAVDSLTQRPAQISAQVAALDAEIAKPKAEREGNRTKSDLLQEKNALTAELDTVAPALESARVQLTAVKNDLSTRQVLSETPSELNPAIVPPDGTIVPKSDVIETSANVPDTRAAETAVAQVKRNLGMLVSSREARLVPKLDEANQQIAVPETGNQPRSTTKVGTPQDRQTAIEGVAVESIRKNANELAPALSTNRKSAFLKSQPEIIAAAVEAAKAPTIEEAQKKVYDAAIKALAGTVNKADAETFATAVSKDIGRAPTFYSKGASETPTVYHGTNAEKFAAFDATKMGTGQQYQGQQVPGFWFASDPGMTAAFGKNQIAAKLSLKKPFKIGAAEYLQRFHYDGEDAAAFRAGLEKKGYDGLHITAEPEYENNSGPQGTAEWGQDNYVAFNQKQIKQVGALESNAAPLTSEQFFNLPIDAKNSVVDYYDQTMAVVGRALLGRLDTMLGIDPNRDVSLFSAKPGEPIGSYTRPRIGEYKSLISLALNAKNGLSVADHEGYHYAEDQLLDGRERQIVTRALQPGTALFQKVLDRAQQYDLENRTRLADEIRSTPEEARAYAFEFWKRGELEASGLLAKAWAKIKDFLEKLSNHIQGLGFTSIEDVFTALDRGAYAERTAHPGGMLDTKYLSEAASALQDADGNGSVRAEPGVDMVRMAKLLGPQLYGNMSDIGPTTVKELFQNSFDALKGAIKLGQRAEGKISISLDRNERSISLTDNGTGMTPNTINKAFLTLAGTAKETERASGGLGIAKMLFLFGNKSLQLRTVRDGLESTLNTSGEQLMAAFSDPSKAPSIITRRTDDPSGTTVTVKVPDTYHDEDSGEDKDINFPQSWDIGDLLRESPLFEPIDVEVNGEPMPIGKHFPADAYTVLSVVKFAWGKARVLVAPVEYAPYQNVSVLSNGLFQFGQKIRKDPADEYSGAAPYKFFINVEPDVSADSPKYPIALNRKGFSPAAQKDFAALTKYIGVLYANKKDADSAQSFGELSQVTENGKRSRTIDLAVPPAQAGTVLSINKDDKVEVVEGRLHINNREVPELTKEELTKIRQDPSQFRVDQKLLDPKLLVIHDNVLLDGKPYLEEARAALGERVLNGYLYGIGGVFRTLRNAVANVGGGEYRDVAQVPVGVSVDTEYYGVNTTIPFKAMMLNPTLARGNNRAAAPALMVSTMIHELAHHKQKNHSETGFIPELQRLAVALAMSGDTKRAVVALEKIFNTYGDAFDYFKRNAENGHLKNRGIRLGGDADETGGKDIFGRVSGERGAGRDGGNGPNLRSAPESSGANRGQGGRPQGPSAPNGRGAGNLNYTAEAKAALAEMEQRIQNGEIERDQAQDIAARILENANLSDVTGKQAFGALWDEMGGNVGRWWKTWMATPNYIGKFSKAYENVRKVLLGFDQYKQMQISRWTKEALSTWHDGHLTRQDEEAVGTALLERTSKGYSASSPEYTALRAKLTERQTKMFDQATRMVAGLLDREFEADKATWEKNLTPEDYATKVTERAAQIAEMKDKGYVPERRYGEHTVRVIYDIVGADGRPQELVVSREHFDRAGQAALWAAQYQGVIERAGSKLRVEQGIRAKIDRDTSISIQQFLDTARRNGVTITQSEKERLVKALTTADSLRRNRMMQRQNIPGYSQDITRILHEFAVGMVSKVAYNKFAPAIDAASDGNPVDVQLTNADPIVTTDPSRDMWKEDGPKSGFYRNQSDELVDYNLVPDHTGSWSRKLRGAGMMYFIGGSLAQGVTNSMQVPMFTVPWLSQHTPYTNAAVVTLGALKDTWANINQLRDVNVLKDPNAKIPFVDAIPGLRAALITAAEDGTNLDTELHQIMGIAQGSSYAKSRGMQKAMNVWMAPFRVSEQANRVASFIAAYKIGQENKLTGRDLYQFAKGVVDNTQNVYSPANRPGMARSNVGAMLFMFKSFPLFTLETMHLMYKQNPKSATYMLLGFAMMSGVNGLPFAGTLEDLIDTIAQRLFNSPFNSRRAMRNFIKDVTEVFPGVDLSQIVLHGVASDMLGVDVANRLGVGNFVPGSRIGAADADYGRTLEQMLGAPFGMVAAGARATTPLLKGDFETALRQYGPSAIRNLIKGTEQFANGYASDARGQKLVDAGTPAALWQSAGFTSQALSKAYEMDAIDNQTKAFYVQVRTEITGEIVKGVRDGNTAKVQEALDFAAAWNRSYPNEPLVFNSATIRRDVAEAGMPLNERTMLKMPRQLRGTSTAGSGQGQ